MLGRYRWESDLTFEQVVEKVAEHVPRIYEADTERDRRMERQIACVENVVYQYDESGKLIFYDTQDAFLTIGTLLTCQAVVGENGHCTVLMGSVSHVSNFFTSLLALVTLVILLAPPVDSGALPDALGMLWKAHPLPIILLLAFCWILIWRRIQRKKVLELLDDIMGGRQKTTRS